MTKKLEELFELPENNDRGITIALPENMEEITTETSEALDKIEAALPQVRGLEASDTEMDELAVLATNSYKDLMDLGMQVDSRFASEIFNSASSFLGHAITSKTAKINKKLKMLDLQLKKAALDQKTAGKEEEINAPKTIERLEEISALRNMQRKMEEEDDDDTLKISNEEISLDSLDVHVINPTEVKIDADLLLDDIEVLA